MTQSHAMNYKKRIYIQNNYYNIFLESTKIFLKISFVMNDISNKI
jgi:hypothetical protein